MNLARIVIRTVDRHCIRGTLRPSIRHYATSKLATNCKFSPIKNTGFHLTSQAYDDNEAFLKTFPMILRDATACNERGLEEFYDQFEKVLVDNLPHGVMYHGLSAVHAYKALHKTPQHISEEELFLVHVVGWCYEMFRAFINAFDDMLDNSETRYGKPCLYKQSDVGMLAIVDSSLMYRKSFDLLKKYFLDKPYYLSIIDLFQEIDFRSLVGEGLDKRCGLEFQRTRSFEKFTFEYQKFLVNLLTTPLVYGPIQMSMIMNGLTDPVAHSQVKHVSSLMSVMWTNLNDYLDVFGDLDKMGKESNDIQEGKLVWPVLTALQMCNTEQLCILQGNYGRQERECVEAVRKLYFDLKLDDVYKQYTKTSYENIVKIIEAPTFRLPSSIFKYCLDFFYQTTKLL